MKRIKSVAFILAFIISTPAFAVNDYSNPNSGKQVCTDGKVCFADDLMKELIKESVETVGKHLLEKAKEKYLNTNPTTTTTTTTTTTPSTTTSDTTYYSRSGSYSPDTTSSTTTSSSTGNDDDIIIID
ncbi:MAG: hypothetical protein A2Y25_11400 [Candidatus Melainabacteria bacterium GWF2_37_15]|nr:MAG: hypothetical protein A2Y25_11400 [Candidatus Melainabacteria bacterium GWF2_37_15]